MNEYGYLIHSAKGTTWSKSDHKYVSKKQKSGRTQYYYSRPKNVKDGQSYVDVKKNYDAELEDVFLTIAPDFYSSMGYGIESATDYNHALKTARENGDKKTEHALTKQYEARKKYCMDYVSHNPDLMDEIETMYGVPKEVFTSKKHDSSAGVTGKKPVGNRESTNKTEEAARKKRIAALKERERKTEEIKRRDRIAAAKEREKQTKRLNRASYRFVNASKPIIKKAASKAYNSMLNVANAQTKAVKKLRRKSK